MSLAPGSRIGAYEIYVMPFSGGGKWQISTGGGVQPRWRRDGKELRYLADNSMMAVEGNGAESVFDVGMVRRLFDVERRVQNCSSLIASGNNLGQVASTMSRQTVNAFS